MAYVVPIHRASSVRHALKLNFLEPEEDCLVVAYDRQFSPTIDKPDMYTDMIFIAKEPASNFIP